MKFEMSAQKNEELSFQPFDADWTAALQDASFEVVASAFDTSWYGDQRLSFLLTDSCTDTKTNAQAHESGASNHIFTFSSYKLIAGGVDSIPIAPLRRNRYFRLDRYSARVYARPLNLQLFLNLSL